MSGADTTRVLEELDSLAGDASTADFVFLFYGQGHDDTAIADFVRRRLSTAAVVGGTSCSGVMTADGLAGPDSIGMLTVADPDGAYGAASAPLGDDPAAAAEVALNAALDAADCSGELPELVWVFQPPGQEEAVIEGLRRIVGDRCPILGGSSADDDVSGRWRQLGPDGPLVDHVVVGVLFSSGGIGVAFQGGYEPTGASGVVTALGRTSDDGGSSATLDGRHILEIDGEPAVDVYNRWLGDTLDHNVVASGGNILEATTLSPLAVDAGKIDEVAHFRLIHPAAVTPKGGLTTFASVDVGTRLYGMRGDRERLVRRVGKVAAAAAASTSVSEAAGALIVYCGGCLLAVGDDAGQVARTAAESLAGAPLLGCFTFGEQGMLLGQNVHANLMISAIVFGR
ncbi:MAG: FIST C-terminal domain-containing protein [Acidimicrobiales bacterium]|nr:FIST C-terminal domain-containing protein [Acidimicrobiales bacterium]